ncbi:MAG TPA: V4R domain-containing protein [Candidatus Bathyarchaeia archaeon]|nr:V4R domain-containing protein [Candidatus Bathyarchaeia archaeon]
MSGSTDRFAANGIRRLVGSLNSIRFKDEIGEVEYFGQKVVMLRRDAFSLMRKEMMRISGNSANIILGIAGRRVGTEEGKALLSKAQALGLKTPQAMPEFVRVAVEETNMGFGKIQVDELNLESGQASVSIANSFESEPVASSPRPACIFTLSYLEGIFSQLIARDVRGREVDCRAKGDKLCRFILLPEPSPGS